MIQFDNEKQFFYIHTKNTTYAMAVRQSDGSLMHLYWGKRLLHGIDYEIMSNMDGAYTYEQPFEYSTYGTPDMRIPSFDALTNDGSRVVKLVFKCYRIVKGKPTIEGLPATYTEDKDNAQTLEITLYDNVQNIYIILRYTSFYNYDAITRSVEIINHGEKLHLNSIMSATVDFYNMPQSDLITLDGAWSRERKMNRRNVISGNQGIESHIGGSGHMHNPFIAVCDIDTTESRGDVYGFSLVYSGNFTAGIELNHFNCGRAYIGINPFHFDWILNKNQSFKSPESVLVYSSEGLGGMSRIYHRLFRERLCRGKYRDVERPVIINNWEATYFNFNEEKILEIAENAAKIGVDIVVLDDGWFGKRDSDNCSLGDWYEDRRKLPGGLEGLSEKINDLGLGFGLWLEPEMVSPDSDLYRAHPDWKLGVNGREGTLKRNQYTLDLSREDVCEYIYNAVVSILRRVNIQYIKWDMNRFMTEAGSSLLPSEQQGEVMHRYMLGLYGVLERIVSEFPDILFESCAGGGGRFDPGMLYYMPQAWVSDDTDAIERLYIQHGTSMVYPYSAMGCHVSTCPNHQIGRTTPFQMRCNVAMPGQFGFELDLSKCSEKELKLAKASIDKYRSLQNTFHYGDCYRLTSPLSDDIAVTEFISSDGNTVVVSINTIKPASNTVPKFIKLDALESDAVYKNTDTEKTYAGEYLMNVGIQFKNDREHGTCMLVLTKE